MRKLIILCLFWVGCIPILAQNHTGNSKEPEKYRYWFDNDSEASIKPYTGKTMSIDAMHLAEGFHVLHYQLISKNGVLSPARSTSFYRLSSTGNENGTYTINNVRYWFDDDSIANTTSYTAGIAQIDASKKDEGFHVLHYQVISSQGIMSPARSVSFYRLSPTGNENGTYVISSVRYWFDDDTESQSTPYVVGTAQIDASKTEEGFHVLHYQVVSSQGIVSPTRSVSFYRLSPTGDESGTYAITSVRYWIDTEENAKTTSYNKGIINLDLSSLSEGTHTFHYQAFTNNGIFSPVRSIVFDRYFYDIYIKTATEYDAATVENDPELAAKPELKMHYLDSDLSIRGQLTVDEGATVSLGKYVQTGLMGKLNTEEKFDGEGEEYYHPTTLVNRGFMRSDSVLVKERFYKDKWHFISLPFNVNVADIDVPASTYWALRRYDGDIRAAGYLDETWVNLQNEETMEAHKGYILQLTSEQKNTPEITFKAINDTHKNDIFASDDITVDLEEHQAEFPQNRSWNLIGNPYPSFYDTRCMDMTGNIIVWNGNGYTAWSLTDDNYILMPFEAFFVQKPIEKASVTFHKEGRQHEYGAPDEPEMNRAPRRDASCERHIFNFILTDGEIRERSRVVLNEQTSTAYELGVDAVKFMPSRPSSPQLFSVESGVRYAINERPLGNGLVTFSAILPHDGEYTIRMEDNTQRGEDILVIDMDNNQVANLYDGYTFTSAAGSYPGRFVVSFTGNANGISQINVFDNGEISVVNGTMKFGFDQPHHVSVYGMDGKTHFDRVTASDDVCLGKGIYVIIIDGHPQKIVVK